MTRRVEKMSSWLREKTAMYFASHLKIKNGFVSVNQVEIDPSLTKAKILITVYPEEQEKEVVLKLKNLKKDFIGHIKKDFEMKKLPNFEFAIDVGEKKRIKIEEILAKK